MRDALFRLHFIVILLGLVAAPAGAHVNHLYTCQSVFESGRAGNGVFGSSYTPPSFSTRSSRTLPFDGIIELSPFRYRASIDAVRFRAMSAPETSGTQEMSNWCWAAAIKMVLNYHRIPIRQSEIVEYGHGRLVNEPGGAREILGTLNNWFRTIDGRRVLVRSKTVNPREPGVWIDFISHGEPLIVGLRGSATNAPGHAFVLKAIDYSREPGVIDVHSVTLADPWPLSPAEITMSGEEFAHRLMEIFAVY